MTPEQLKQSILQYAMEGKLVVQKPEEGTADTIYKEIQEEKKKLAQEGKIKRLKKISEVSEDERLYDIPDTWKWVYLKDIISVYGGKRIPAGQKLTKENTGHIYIRVTDMKNGSISSEDIHYVSDEIYTKIKNYTISNKDIYITVAGSIGRIGIIPNEFNNANLTENADKLVIYSLNKKFILYLMSSPVVQKQIVSSTTKVGQPKLAIKRIENIIIPLPPIQEQVRISERIEEILPLVDQYAISWEKLEQLNAEFPDKMKKSILQYAIQGKLVEQKPEEGTAEELYEQIKEEKNKLIKEGKIKKEKALAKITEEEVYFDIPDTWKWVKLGEVITLQSGQDLKRTEYNDSKEGIPYITGASNINDNGEIIINRWTDVPKAYANSGDLLLTCKGTVGKMAFLEYDKVHIARQIMAIKTYYIDARYIKYFLETQILNLKNKAKSMIPGIERNNVLNLLLPLPPLKEQYRIVKKIEELLIYCSKLEK